MRIEPFGLERWLSENESSCRYNLAKASPPPFTFQEVFGPMNPSLKLGYGTTQGSVLLRRKISQLYEGVDERNVLVTSGAAEADYLAANAILNGGEEVIAPVPSYRHIVGVARGIGSKVLQPEMKESENYDLDLGSVSELVTAKTKLIWVTNPNNPTGAKFTTDQVKGLCEIAKDADAYLVFDEALKGLELDDIESPSPVGMYEKAVCTRSITKIGFAGLRIGWLVGNRELIREAWAYKDYTTLSHSAIGEFLAEQMPEKDELLKIYYRNRSLLRDRLSVLTRWMDQHRNAFSFVPPKAGASAFPGYVFKEDSVEFCKSLLREEGLLLSPGDYFGGPKHFRIYYGQDPTVLREALLGFDHFLSKHA